MRLNDRNGISLTYREWVSISNLLQATPEDPFVTLHPLDPQIQDCVGIGLREYETRVLEPGGINISEVILLEFPTMPHAYRVLQVYHNESKTIGLTHPGNAYLCTMIDSTIWDAVTLAKTPVHFMAHLAGTVKDWVNTTAEGMTTVERLVWTQTHLLLTRLSLTIKLIDHDTNAVEYLRGLQQRYYGGPGGFSPHEE